MDEFLSQIYRCKSKDYWCPQRFDRLFCSLGNLKKWNAQEKDHMNMQAIQNQPLSRSDVRETLNWEATEVDAQCAVLHDLLGRLWTKLVYFFKTSFFSDTCCEMLTDFVILQWKARRKFSSAKVWKTVASGFMLDPATFQICHEILDTLYIGGCLTMSKKVQ